MKNKLKDGDVVVYTDRQESKLGDRFWELLIGKKMKLINKCEIYCYGGKKDWDYYAKIEPKFKNIINERFNPDVKHDGVVIVRSDEVRKATKEEIKYYKRIEIVKSI